MRYKTLAEAHKAQMKGQTKSIPSQEFIPVKITERTKKGLVFKAIAEDGVEVEYIRRNDGLIKDVGIRFRDKKGNAKFKSYFKRVDRDLHLSPLDKITQALEKQEWLDRNSGKDVTEDQ